MLFLKQRNLSTNHSSLSSRQRRQLSLFLQVVSTRNPMLLPDTDHMFFSDKNGMSCNIPGLDKGCSKKMQTKICKDTHDGLGWKCCCEPK